MFYWYQCAEICFAYLSDVRLQAFLRGGSAFSSSRWFTRGWTLQELIAPKEIVFMSSDWHELGTRSSLCEETRRITGIGTMVLLDPEKHKTCSIATKMAWAAKRTTTRTEDGAYCLMGLFGVNMPLLYGERHQAFARLQEEILRRSEDTTIFSSFPSTALPLSFSNLPSHGYYHGCLATSPADFIIMDKLKLHHLANIGSTKEPSGHPNMIGSLRTRMGGSQRASRTNPQGLQGEPSTLIRQELVKDFVRLSTWMVGPYDDPTIKDLLLACCQDSSVSSVSTEQLARSQNDDHIMFNLYLSGFRWSATILALIGFDESTGRLAGILLVCEKDGSFQRWSFERAPILMLSTESCKDLVFRQQTVYLRTRMAPIESSMRKVTQEMSMWSRRVQLHTRVRMTPASMFKFTKDAGIDFDFATKYADPSGPVTFDATEWVSWVFGMKKASQSQSQSQSQSLWIVVTWWQKFQDVGLGLAKGPSELRVLLESLSTFDGKKSALLKSINLKSEDGIVSARIDRMTNTDEELGFTTMYLLTGYASPNFPA